MNNADWTFVSKSKSSSDYLSPSFSEVSTFTFSQRPTVFNPRRTTSRRTVSSPGIVSVIDGMGQFGLPKADENKDSGLLSEIKGVLSKVGKTVIDYVGKENSIEEQGDSDMPSEKRFWDEGVKSSSLGAHKTSSAAKHVREQDSSHDHAHGHLTPKKQSTTDKFDRLHEKLNESITPERSASFVFKSSKDPFRWGSAKPTVKDTRKGGYAPYGSTFYKRKARRLNCRRLAGDSITINESSDDIAHLRMLYNGEYQVPKMIEAEKKKQLLLMESERAGAGFDSSTKSNVTSLTERINALLLKNRNTAEDDDLIIVREHKIEPPPRKLFSINRQLKFDTSLLSFQEEFESYKKLLEDRDRLRHEIRIKRETKDLVPKLASQSIDSVNRILKRSDNGVLYNKNNIELKVHDFKTLAPRRWLNDTIIEFFMKYIELQIPTTAAFNSYFYTTLSDRGYQGVRRWMKKKKKSITSLKMIFAPINLNQSHWALGVINIEAKKIFYLDSLSNGPSGLSFSILKDLQNYIIEESGGALGSDFGLEYLECPQQPNGFDCGIYVCMNTLYLSRSVLPTFDEKVAARMRYYIGHLIINDGK
ncbi:LAMI_0F12552g1_1 [Lachancea mirantina]|uniref:LAMI_0F12552g1_1 n=1 Tax=Lachancea mirantina TaxID=1230905 RepID=A0A1G4K393_9SACH|nr:LAMI_0F12552g1_1 [Lachancea mirantina]